ncbi:hypothetical protein [Legionella worsleiensis]|uniref:UDP-N-acetylglucosamine 2-epimerase n=1 Tax=Legionella worsleiensis TaxID=45076 RepID=A0A0W1A3A8_9GAMM|nr:hypothetical protein [Legionella worsleiensis]KTD75874.1 hypothetical protein Lwor_2440 [Legionella worsleiensis]STY32887.1 Uncharacterised protein [Legionella worsleiensis]
MSRKKILVSCRDVGAAINIIEIVKLAQNDAHFDLFLYIQSPASTYFKANNLSFESVPHIIATEPESEAGQILLDYAQKILNQIKPDILLCGLSTPGDAGIDEALIAVAKNKVPSVVMQDFWGEVNDFFGVCADYYFCLDHEAKRLTEERNNCEGLVIGSPRHSWYKSLNLNMLRNELREEAGLLHNQLVIGLFGQSLHHISGYKDTLVELLNLIYQVQPEAQIVYRQHPRESEEHALMTIELLERSSVSFKLVNHRKVEHSLIMCDAVCSILSNCLYDASYLNFFSATPFITPIAFCYKEDILKHLNNYNMIKASPYKKMNIATIFDAEKPERERLRYLFSDQGKQEHWIASKKLENPDYAAANALNYLSELTCKIN